MSVSTRKDTAPPAGDICFSEEDWQKLREYTKLCPVEVACLGYANIDGSTVHINDVFLVPQLVSGASVEFVDTGFPYAVQKAIEEGRTEELRFCWHSHVNFSAHFSATDKEMVRKVRDAAPIPWFASVVLNKKDEVHAQLDYFKPEGELGEFTRHIVLPMEVTIEGDALDMEDTRIEELEQFLKDKPKPEPKTVASVKPKGTMTASEREAAERKQNVKGATGLTADDWKFHNLAKEKGWACYISEDGHIHYWDEVTKSYFGSALAPVNKEGELRIDVTERCVDFGPFSHEYDDVSPTSAEDKKMADDLVRKVMERGQL